jgi:hypothetical protein
MITVSFNMILKGQKMRAYEIYFDRTKIICSIIWAKEARRRRRRTEKAGTKPDTAL